MQYGLDRAGKGSETLRPNVPRNFGPGYGIMTQSRTFIHYVEVLRDNGLPAIKCTHVGDVGNPFNAYEYESAMGYIPYSNICASMNLNRFQTFMIQALRFRPLEFGYMISDVVPLSDELTNLGGAVVQNTTFNERPFMIHYVDKHNRLFPLRDVKTNEILPNRKMDYPLTMERGESESSATLRQFKFALSIKKEVAEQSFLPTTADASANASHMFNVLDCDDASLVASGDVAGYTFHCPQMPMFVNGKVQFGAIDTANSVPGLQGREPPSGGLSTSTAYRNQWYRNTDHPPRS
jgi:hypothetical protein